MVKKIHGGDIYTDRKLPPDVKLVDFSANLNPLGMPQAVKDALCRDVDSYQNYPDPQCRQLRRAIGSYYGVPDDWIVCGNGAADVIWRLVLARKPRRALLPAPTFSEYAEALERLAGERTIRRVIVDPSAASFIEVLRRRGFQVVRANNDVADGIRVTSDLLKKRRIVICRTCGDCLR